MSTLTEPTVHGSRISWATVDTWVVAKRHLLHLVRRPDELLGTLMIPVMAVAMFGFVFGEAFGVAIDVPGEEYREFLLPGLFALTMAFGILGRLPGAAVRLSERASADVSYPAFFDDLPRITTHG